MDPQRYLASLREDAVGLLAAARLADPAATVPGCPEWTTMDLVWHIGEVHRFWGTVVGQRLSGPPDDWSPGRPDSDAGVLDFAEESARLLVEHLAGVDPATPVWTWCDWRQDAGFVLRRMAQETAVHRVDAERTAELDHRIPPELAADGIDEYLTIFLLYPDPAAGSLNGSVHVHCTDTDGEWTVTAGDDGTLSVSPGHAKGDAALRGAAHDLLMALWRRDGLDGVDVFGDRDLAARFVARTNND